MLERWTRAVLRFRLVVLVCWLAVLGGGVWAATGLPPLLANTFDVPGSESQHARELLAHGFGERPDGIFTVVFPVLHGSRKDVQAAARQRLERAAAAVPTGHAGVLRVGGGILYGDVETTLDLQLAKRYAPTVRRALRTAAGPEAIVTGQPAFQHDLDPVFSGDLRRGEAIALPAALLVLLLVLGISAAVAVPFLVAAGSIAATFLAVYGVAHALPMVTYVTNLVELIGLGLAIDYSLLVVLRYREELSALDARELVDEAIVRTQATAGRSVVFSGLAVAIGLALLALMPVPFLRSMGVGGCLIPLTSIAAALTLQPALLSLLGRRGAGRMRAAAANGFWTRLAGLIMRRRFAVLGGVGALLVAAAIPVAGLRLSPGSITGIPQSLESVRGYELLRDGVGRGAVTPTRVVVDTGRIGGARTRPVRAAVDRLADELFHDPEVALVASGRGGHYVDRSGQLAQVFVAGRHEYGSEPSQRFVDRLRRRLIPAARFPDVVRVSVGGVPAQGVDFLDRSYDAFPWLVAAALALTFLVLLRAFRSLLLPLKAVVLNVLTVAAVYGVLSLLYSRGSGQVDGWVPIFLFAVLFGLSMDYEVFLVMRMREAWDDVRDNERAVALGLERTGGMITAAAAIMIAAFSGFLAGRVAGLQQFGVGLVLAVAIDATLVRALLVPALMAVLGRWNWWLPKPLARLARLR